MKKQMLKIAGVKSEKEFYKKFPTEEAFMAKHGKAFKKAQIGTYMTSGEAPAPFVPLDVHEMQSDINYAITGMTDAERRQLAAIQAQQANQSQGGSGQLTALASTLAESGAAEKGKKIPKAQEGGKRSILTGGLPRIQTPTAQQLTSGMPSQTITPSATPSAMKGVGGGGIGGATPYMQAAGDIIQGIQMLKEEKQALQQARQQEQLTGVFAQAAASRPVQQPRRQYVRPEDIVMQPEQMFPSYGVGTNILNAQDGTVIRDGIGGNPTEIMNVYNPGTIYTDLGYEPLNDSNKVKAFQKGGKLTQAKFGNQNWMQGTQFADIMGRQGGGQFASGLGEYATGGPSGGSKLGKGIGTAAGTAFFGPVGGAVGGAIGSFIGGALDQKQEKIEAANQRRDQNISKIVGQSTGLAIQNMNRSFMQDGGTTSPYKWMSHTWQPQVITTFGEHKVKDLLTPPKDADMLRAGGHLKEYTPPSERAMSTERPAMQMGGDLEIHWGGRAEPISYNPYLPEGGETIMFKGQSHDESDGQGNTGIGITWGKNPVEVEDNEPAQILKDGTTGDSNLTVFGNIKITNAFADMLADPKAKGKKFKTYVADLSKQENKQNKLIDKSVDQLDDLDVQSSFDKLALGTLQANIQGANAKLKDLAKKKMDAAALQNAINDTKEEELVKITDKGDVLAKKGADIPKAQMGVTEQLLKNPQSLYSLLQQTPETSGRQFSKGRANAAAAVRDSVSSQRVVSPVDNEYMKSYKPFLNKDQSVELPRINIPSFEATKITPKISATPTEAKQATVTPPTTSKANLIPFLTQALQQLRPSDIEELDANQLVGEMYALSQNQVEPVYAQKFIPELSTPIDISLQDILNENQAAYNATQRLVGYNPAALASLNAQKYAANQRVLGEQFRLNQAERQRVYEQNRNLLNQAQLQNLQILERQADKQAMALSKTKATTQAALNSIASKYAQNKLENRTLATYENLYNYRYDPNFRLQNMQIAQFNTPTIATTAKTAKSGKAVKKLNLNSSIVKSLKNI